MDISDKGAVEECFRLYPEIVAFPSLALRIGDQRRHEFQDVLFTVDIGKRIVVHALFEIDRIKDANLVIVL